MFATASPRRVELAKKLDCVKNGRITPVFAPSNVNEVSLDGKDRAARTARANARLKAEHAAKTHDAPVIAFDTVVGIGDEVLGKPTNKADALRMFKLLCGNTHSMITAVCIIANGKVYEDGETTFVTFGAFDPVVTDRYIESGAPFDKAGGYNIADAELAPIVSSVIGGIDNVVGMPLTLSEKLIEENILYGEARNSH